MCGPDAGAPEAQGVGLVLPALLLPVEQPKDEEERDWVSQAASDIMADWWSSLLKCASFAEVEEPIGEQIELGAGISIDHLVQNSGLSRLRIEPHGSEETLLWVQADPGTPTHFIVEFPDEPSLARFELTWLMQNLSSYTTEEIAELGLVDIRLPVSDGESSEIEITYERLSEALHVRLWGEEYVKPLFAIEVRAAGITTLELEPRASGSHPGSQFLLLRRVCSAAAGCT
jgi:hypothetical protein